MRLSEELLRLSIAHIIGYEDKKPLGGVRVVNDTGNKLIDGIADFFFFLIHGKKEEDVGNPLSGQLTAEYNNIKEIFCRYYDQKAPLAESLFKSIKEADSDEERAKIITKLWLPELDISEKDIIKRWKVKDVQEVPPIDPTKVTIQLNGLYTLPETIPNDLAPELLAEWNRLSGDYGKKIADYDHPVHLFEKDELHELVNCLDEMEDDLAFEKEKGVLPDNHKMLITLSISVTHERIDSLCGIWIKSLLKNRSYNNIRVIVLTEDAVFQIKEKLFHDRNAYPVYSVFGKYGMHFNTLKYTQLLLEKAYGILAGFKLDTDEGMRSRDAYKVTGKTWLQIMSHTYWGAKATDWKGREVTLDINEGEYINSKDIDKMGYEGSVRCPDVSVPDSYIGPEIFFNKAFAHGKATALYNTFDRLEDDISHTVVKGGGYGITNKGLRKAVPFTYSQVGRAEDQQFYFSGLNGGIRGAFHPDLRIAHYKSAVAKSEHKTLASRFIGDMYRLVIFQKLVSLLGVKDEIDPMPGVFAGEFARCQAFFNVLYKAYALALSGDAESSEILINEGLQELSVLKQEIDQDLVEEKLEQERRLWEKFVQEVDGLENREEVKEVFEKFII